MKKWENNIISYLNNDISDEELLSFKKKRLLEVFSYTKENSKFYKKKFKEIELSQTDTFNSLKTLPFTTKRELRDASLDICCMSLDKVEVYYETTGTTGPTTPCPRSKLDVICSGAYVKNALEKIYKERFGDTNALTAIMGPSELYAFGDTYGNICKELSIPYVKLWPESPRVGLVKASKLIRDLEIKVLICSPAIALSLARYYKSINISLSDLKVKQILLLGELCTKEMLNNISSLWSCNCTHGLYGSQEVHTLATGDSRGNLNISDTNYIFELIPIKNFDSKKIGELCVTMLVPGAKPLIRFKTGDVVEIHNDKSLEVLGRKSDIIKINSHEYLPADIEKAILREIKMLYGYAVSIYNDCLKVDIISPLKSIDLEKTRKALSNYFGIEVYFNIVTELDEQTEKGAYVSWKYARIKDYRNEQF
ncbi:phenylacetate--CoA ligase family protein [Streptococcus sp. S784/96/1]|uniref:phenylacetate--CoA ligase family protein n=1 Tax=Streptococcus sp. S784/96/1 TaxID=2653499 RepID=UPI00138A4785|nr:phenylacetate--CoA ligase family protein [Streptococcus sp. S784/96/1]